MALPQSWLRCGMPSESISEMCSQLRGKYAVWYIVVAAPRTWSDNLGSSRCYNPIVLLYFADTENPVGVESPSTEKWQLLRTYHFDPQNGVRSTVVGDAMKVLERVPSEQLPDAVKVLCDSTRDNGLYCASDIAADIGGRLSSSKTKCVPDTSLESSVWDFVYRVFDWMVSVKNLVALRDISDPPFMNCEEGVRRAFLTALDGHPLVTFIEHSEESVVGSHSWLFDCELPVAGPWKYCCVTAEQCSELESSRHRTVAIHLARDPGDIVFERDVVERKKIEYSTEGYDDFLHADGEVVIAFRLKAATHFSDLAAFTQLGFSAGWKPMCERPSVSLFPRIYFQRPATKTAGPRIPNAAPTLQKECATPEMLKDVLEALSLLRAASLAPTVKPPYGPVTLPPDVKYCMWCSRPRLSMAKCSICHVFSYCSREHQSHDWKLRHKTECQHVLKAMEDKSYFACTNPPSHLQSSALTLLSILHNSATPSGPSALEVVHVISVSDPLDFAQAFAEAFSKKPTKLPLRLVIASEKIPYEKHHEVLQLEKGEIAALTVVPPTGIVGDVWHESGRVLASPLLVRLYGDKYHEFYDKNSSELLRPSLVASLNTSTLGGLGFFNAGIRVLTQQYYGVVPMHFAEPSYIAAHRTLAVLETQFTEKPNVRALVRPIRCAPNFGQLPAALQRDNSEPYARVAPTFSNAYLFSILPAAQ